MTFTGNFGPEQITPELPLKLIKVCQKSQATENRVHITPWGWLISPSITTLILCNRAAYIFQEETLPKYFSSPIRLPDGSDKNCPRRGSAVLEQPFQLDHIKVCALQVFLESHSSSQLFLKASSEVYRCVWSLCLRRCKIWEYLEAKGIEKGQRNKTKKKKECTQWNKSSLMVSICHSFWA